MFPGEGGRGDLSGAISGQVKSSAGRKCFTQTMLLEKVGCLFLFPVVASCLVKFNGGNQVWLKFCSRLQLCHLSTRGNSADFATLFFWTTVHFSPRRRCHCLSHMRRRRRRGGTIIKNRSCLARNASSCLDRTMAH